MSLSLRLAATLVALATLTAVAAAQPTHPLDPLSEAEVASAVKVLRAEKKLRQGVMLPQFALREPPKPEVLAFRPGQAFRREVATTLFDRKANKVFEAVVDLRARKISSYREIKGVFPPVMLSEFDSMAKVVKADPRFAAAMKKRGIKNLDDVQVDIWGYGTPDSPAAAKKRLLRAIAYFKGKGENFYARPIDGWSATVDVAAGKIDRIIDTAILPIPPNPDELDAASQGVARTGLKPLLITQPNGKSFQLLGQEVTWQNWKFRFSMHPREGLVLHTVSYNDKGVERPVLYRASLSEMVVPYGHNDPQWTWRAAFDEGEYGIGRYSGSLEVGQDVPTNSTLIDAMFVDDFGKPYTTKNVVAIFERDGGLLWKHFNMYNGTNESRRARQLVITFITTISNYDYGLSWVFHQDGALELETTATGIMLAKGSTMTKVGEGHEHHGSPDARFAHLVAPNVVAPHHQHFFNMRIDLDVDGDSDNAVAELDAVPVPPGPDNPGLNAFDMKTTILASEKAARRDPNWATQRKWAVINTKKRTGLGYNPGYVLIPGVTAPTYLHKDAPLRRRGGFIDHVLWATPFAEDEMHAAGTYPSQRQTPEGLPAWTERDRPLVGKDVVLWFNFCVTHAPRPEEWPVMDAHHSGFKLIPYGFFDRNPAMDVPRTPVPK